MKWFFIALSNFYNYKGRARRKEFWYFVLFVYVFGAVAMWLDWQYGLPAPFPEFSDLGPLNVYFTLFMIIPGLAVSVRRLHDLGEGGSGWILLVILLPFIGMIILIFLMARPGHPGPNKYGPDPKAKSIP